MNRNHVRNFLAQKQTIPNHFLIRKDRERAKLQSRGGGGGGGIKTTKHKNEQTNNLNKQKNTTTTKNVKA